MTSCGRSDDCPVDIIQVAPLYQSPVRWNLVLLLLEQYRYNRKVQDKGTYHSLASIYKSCWQEHQKTKDNHCRCYKRGLLSICIRLQLLRSQYWNQEDSILPHPEY